MGEFARTFLAAADIRCRLDLPATLPLWPLTAETRHNLFLAFKETLNNVLKHAAATEVRISLSVQPNHFALIVKDNGRGFEPGEKSALRPDRATGGNGLDNLQRRLAHIGGRCEITSHLGEGTTVSFIIGIPETDTTTDGPPVAPS
jgi:signal transduction histidine kinase